VCAQITYVRIIASFLSTKPYTALLGNHFPLHDWERRNERSIIMAWNSQPHAFARRVTAGTWLPTDRNYGGTYLPTLRLHTAQLWYGLPPSHAHPPLYGLMKMVRMWGWSCHMCLYLQFSGPLSALRIALTGVGIVVSVHTGHFWSCLIALSCGLLWLTPSLLWLWAALASHLLDKPGPKTTADERIEWIT
jgi:hypothetical protein